MEETDIHELRRDPSARPTIHASSRRMHNATDCSIQCLSCILGNFQTLGSRPRSGGQPSIAVSRAQLSQSLVCLWFQVLITDRYLSYHLPAKAARCNSAPSVESIGHPVAAANQGEFPLKSK